MVVSKPKRTKIVAARRFASIHSQPIRRPPECTVGVTDGDLKINNSALNLEQTIYEINNQILLTEPVITKRRSLPYLTKTAENRLREHLASVCQAVHSISSEIEQRNPRLSIAVVYNVPDHIPLDSFKNNFHSAYNMSRYR